jgi:TetR/AcrR family transcriptional regulator, tetracycline repressor protein
MRRTEHPLPAPRRGRGRPAKISRERIVDAALQLGLDTFSMQGVAEHLGVTSPALYSHVSSRDEVVLLVRGALRDRVAGFSSTARGWREWLTDFARSVRRDLAGSASTLMVDVRGPGKSWRLTVVEPGLRLLIAEGLTPAEAGYATWLVFRVAMTAAVRQHGELNDYVDETAQMLATARGDDLHATQSVRAAMLDENLDDTLDLDLEIVLDGIAKRIARRRRSKP